MKKEEIVLRQVQFSQKSKMFRFFSEHETVGSTTQPVEKKESEVLEINKFTLFRTLHCFEGILNRYQAHYSKKLPPRTSQTRKLDALKNLLISFLAFIEGYVRGISISVADCNQLLGKNKRNDTITRQLRTLEAREILTREIGKNRFRLDEKVVKQFQQNQFVIPFQISDDILKFDLTPLLQNLIERDEVLKEKFSQKGMCSKIIEKLETTFENKKRKQPEPEPDSDCKVVLNDDSFVDSSKYFSRRKKVFVIQQQDTFLKDISEEYNYDNPELIFS